VRKCPALREYVKHEDDLINFRVTWSLTIRFPFAVYALTLPKILDDPAKGGLLWWLCFMLAVIGIYPSWIARHGTGAASDALRHIESTAR
jgi:hypothetical protein